MLVILDRDGVINYESKEYVKTPDEWISIEGSLEAIAALKKAGHHVVIMTNQAGVGRGIIEYDNLMAIFAKLENSLKNLGATLDGIYFCTHHPDENCECRKPKPGMLKQIKQDFPHEWDQRLVIGDSWRDMQAAIAMSTPCWLVRTGFGSGFIEAGDIPVEIPVFADLSAAVRQILGS